MHSSLTNNAGLQMDSLQKVTHLFRGVIVTSSLKENQLFMAKEYQTKENKVFINGSL